MVSHKCVEEFRYKSYQLPVNARAPRSARKRRSFEKKMSEDDEMGGAIELLATVAENLLFDSGTFLLSTDKPVNGIEDKCLLTQNSVKQEFPVEEKPLMPVALSVESPYKGSLSPCEFSSVINGKVENGVEGFRNSGVTDSCEVGDFCQDVKPSIDAGPNVVVSLGSSSRTEVPSVGDGASHGVRDDVNLFSKDDDEKFSGYIHPRLTKKSNRNVPRIGDRRIRKILASRHWKGGSTSRHAGSNPHKDVKPVRNCYLHHQRNYPIKKRRYFDHISDDMQRGSRVVSSMKGQGASFVSSGSHVRLRIKSFRVPELFVEIPETATVGSLKRMVMEAVSSLLSDGHRVGLMVHGKKVRDDNKTLHQTGISNDNTHLDSLDFSLEPSSEKPQLLTSNPSGPVCEELPMCAASNIENVFKSDHDSAMFPSDSFGIKTATDDSKALVPVALTELCPRPLGKSRKSEQQAAQRRIRRPFSVTEVEALVQAVEKIGTGRWRDVKLCAFEDAEHRTYVDLKDKWKTLVHTAKISPQQRRGEPVPQELLDRVLNAHGYWSQQHKQLQLNVNKQETEALLLI